MYEIVEPARARWPVEAVAIVHRIGVVPIGEASVVIAVSAGHRVAAFEACHFAIDRLKEVVPIWKKEHFDGGELWIGSQTGTAFPAGTARP
jgi:molybdopterin synthase catalytic subunit